MRRIIVALVAILCASLPITAQAWQLGVKTTSTAGTITVRGGTPVTYAKGTVYSNYTTTAANPNTIPVSVNVTNSCYAIQKVVYNGITALNPASPWQRSFTPADGSSQYAVAYFYATQLSLSASVASNGGGYVTPSSALLFSCGSTPSSDLIVKFVPSTGGSVAGISNLPPGAVQTGDFGVTNGTVTITVPKAAAASLTQSYAMVGTFSGVKANAGAPQTVLPGTKVTLSGSAIPSAGATYSWTVSGPSTVTLNNATTATPDFTPASVGTYSCNLSVNGGASQSSVSVTVTTSAAAAARNQCANCHIASGVGVKSNVFATWSSSQHQANLVMCANCHVGSDSGAHPGVTVTSANSCEVCHSGAQTMNFQRGVHWTNQMNNFTDLATARAYLLAAEGPNGADVPPNGDWSPNCSISCHFKQAQGKDACLACHNNHRPETGLPSDPTAANTIFFAYSSLPSAATAAGTDASGNATVESLQYGYWRHDTGCASCHHQGNGEGNAPLLLDNSDFPTAPHFDTTATGNGVGTGVAFMNGGQTCSNCHGHNNSINVDYAQSGHGDVTSPAWAEGGASSPCVRCHTTQGFINYSTFKVVTPIAATKSVLGCNACHNSPDMTYSPFGNLTSVNGQVGSIRKIAAYPATYSASGSANVSFQFPDAGPSNICIPCHSGRTSGQNIQGLTSALTNTSFKNPHYVATAGILYKSIGYEYAGQDYTNPQDQSGNYFEHDLIGSNSVDGNGVSAPGTGIVGPCAGCHMYSPDGSGPGHTLHVFTEDQTGAVTAINNPICVGCHTTGGDPGALDFSDLSNVNAQISGFNASLGALQSLLQSKGAFYSPTVYGYFFTDSSYTTAVTNWSLGGVSTNAAGKNNMGAAFNLQLLTKEPGAYAHNRNYTKRLIFDSIDWLQNGAITGTIDIGSITNYTNFDSAAAISYLGATRP